MHPVLNMKKGDHRCGSVNRFLQNGNVPCINMNNILSSILIIFNRPSSEFYYSSNRGRRIITCIYVYSYKTDRVPRLNKYVDFPTVAAGAVDIIHRTRSEYRRRFPYRLPPPSAITPSAAFGGAPIHSLPTGRTAAAAAAAAIEKIHN